MRPAAFVLSALLLLAIVAAQNMPSRAAPDGASSSAILPCTPEGAAVQGACSPVSLGSLPALVISHEVLAGACPGADLHLVRYLNVDRPGAAVLSARWCH